MEYPNLNPVYESEMAKGKSEKL